MQSLPYVRAEKNLIVGQSAGGWGSIAVSTRDLPGVSAIINFAGGRLGEVNCAVNRLISTAGRFGKESKFPMLWVYTENDSYFPPNESTKMRDAFLTEGGKMDFVMLPPFGKDGHSLFAGEGGAEIWAPEVDKFLVKVGVFSGPTGSTPTGSAKGKAPKGK
jgi:dienelactone hydrolase